MSRYSNRNMKNNVHATLSTALSSIATTIQLSSWQWSRFWTDFPQLATLESVEEWKVVKREIVQITARNGDNLTVVRAFAPCPENDDANSQSQSAISFNADDIISMYITKEHFDKVADSLDDLYDNWNDRLYIHKTWWLWIEITAWNVRVWNTDIQFPWATANATDNATNYVMISDSWTLNITTLWRDEDQAKIWIVIASWWEISSINMYKIDTVWWKMWWWAWIETAICWESITKWDIVSIHDYIWSNIPSWTQNIWDIANNQKVWIYVYWSWISNNILYLRLWKVWNWQNITVRIETDNWWNPSWTLVNANATATISASSLTTTLTKTKITLAWNVSLTLWTKYRVVVSCPSTDTSNYWIIWYTNLKPKSDLVYGWSRIWPSTWIAFNVSWWSVFSWTTEQTTSLNITFSKNIFLTWISYWTSCTITWWSVSYSWSTSWINQNLVAWIQYTITITWTPTSQYQSYWTYASSDPAISSISREWNSSAIPPGSLWNKYFYYSSLDTWFWWMTWSKLFSNYIVKCDTTNIITLSNDIGIANADWIEWNSIAITTDWWIVDNSSRDLTPWQEYLFVWTSMTETKWNFDNCVLLWKAITETQIKLNIKIAIYQWTTETYCPIDWIISSSQTWRNWNNTTAGSSSFVLDWTTYHMSSTPILRWQSFAWAFERAVVYKNR